MSKPYKIRIMRDAYIKLFYFVDKCDVEIGFMGKVTFNQAQQSYDILSVHVPSQEVSAGTTDLDAQAVANLDSDTINEPGHLNAWLHSHVNMGVFWSQTDRDTITELGEQGLCVAVVVNKKREMRGAIYYKGAEYPKDDFYPSLPSEAFHDEVPIEVVDRMPMHKEWAKELEDKVKKKVWSTTASNQYGYWCKETNKWVRHETAMGKQVAVPTTTLTNGTGIQTTQGTTLTASDYMKKYNEYVAELAETCEVENGALKLSRKQKKRLEYLKQRIEFAENRDKTTALLAERAKGDIKPVSNQLSLVDAVQNALGELLYTDEELFHMTYTEMDAELRQLVAQGSIDEEERTAVQDQWRTCNMRIENKSRQLSQALGE